MQIKILTKDNVTLYATLYKSQAAKGVVLINPGTATKTSFYNPFAEYLVENGFHVVLWNYRGFCESKTNSLVNSDFIYSDIGKYDIPAVIDKVKEMFSELPLYCVGHSAGGQQIGLAYNYHKLDALIAVAVSAGYFSYMPLAYRIKANFFFHFFSPVTGAIFNYIPAKRMKLMEDLPVGFVKEWGNWCKEKHLFFSSKFYGKSIPEGTYKNFNVPTYVFSADDDEICTDRNISNFWQHVESEHKINFIRYQSAKLPSQRVGHFGYFKKENKKVWADILEKINEVHCSG
ncbi:MAG: alpha/beta fold hydrolase [Colwellia sp.]